jgi:Protein of unknown function (DUF3293)
MLDDPLWVAYANTVLRIGGKRQIKVDLRQPISADCQRRLTELGLGSAFAVITASNPGGRLTIPWKNRWRQLRMRARLASSRLRFAPADGESPDRSHIEHGFAISLKREAAHAMAREYEQLALYWFDGTRFWLDPVRERIEPKALPCSPHVRLD